MRIGLYNTYWRTFGGGERYAAAMACALSKAHQVEMLGPETVGTGELGTHLGIDLSGVSFRRIGSEGSQDPRQDSAGYDLFINSAFGSNLCSMAPKSILVVFFPHRLTGPATARLMTLLSAALAPAPLIEPLAGFLPPDSDGLAWTGPRAVLRIHPKAFHHSRSLHLAARPQGQGPLENSIASVSGTKLDWKAQDNTLTLTPQVLPRTPIEVEIRSRTAGADNSLGSSVGIGLNLDIGSGRIHSIRRRFSTLCAQHASRSSREFLQSYDVILAISEFTQTWISRRWDIPSKVLPPPVDTASFRPTPGTEKDKTILAVGRFFAGGHNKKHIEMLKVFRRLCDERRLPDGWELHLVGNVHRESLTHLEYFAEVHRLAEGYPVRILPRLGFDELQLEYKSASIFWHATGLDESDRRKPERQEHFGITTCEAMSARCVPVVIAKGGQLEIVRDGDNGFLFSNRKQLANRTAQIAADHTAAWVEVIRDRAEASAERFSHESFDQRLFEILENQGWLQRAR